MCGRYRLSRRKQLIEEYFASVSRGEEDWSPRYNIGPTQPVPVVRQNPKEPVRELSLMRWGLIPSWAKHSAAAASLINARSETAGTKPAFRDALKFRRCLIPTDAFYEWMRTGKTRQPFCKPQRNLFRFSWAQFDFATLGIDEQQRGVLIGKFREAWNHEHLEVPLPTIGVAVIKCHAIA